jgi:hypothetical protein
MRALMLFVISFPSYSVAEGLLPWGVVEGQEGGVPLLCLVILLRWKIHTAIAIPRITATIPRVPNIDLLCMETRETSVWWLEWSVRSPLASMFTF